MDTDDYIQRTAHDLSRRFQKSASEIQALFRAELCSERKDVVLPGWMEEPVHLARLNDAHIDLSGVRIISQKDTLVCWACRNLDGTVYEWEEALRENPLPHAGCSNDLCRCSYLPIIDRKYFREGMIV